MATRKRTMKNTVSGQVEAMAMVSAKIESPIKLDPDESIYFDMVVKSRETASWNPIHLLMASNLAITFAQLDEANSSLASDGLMVRNDRGTKVVNPACAAKSALSATVLQLSKALGLSASQLGVSGKAQQSRNEADAHARGIINKVSEESLLA